MSKKNNKKKIKKPSPQPKNARVIRWLSELDYHPLQKKNNDITNNDRNSKTDVELEQLLNMIRIPIQIEKFMGFTLLASLDCFLYYFTVLPIKIGVRLFSTTTTTSRLARTYKERVTLFLIISVTIIISHLDTSKVYHKIKRQSAMKLYMLFNVLEIADKMLATIGQSLLSVLLTKTSYRNMRAKQLSLILLSLIYLVCHTSVLIYQTISLNVAVNSYSNSLLTLLLSLQFAEIKSSVFKKFDKESLFQITMADSMERFKLLVLVIIIMLRNLGTSAPIHLNFIPIFDRKLLITLISLPIINIFISEILVDWIKHAYITKFNRIRPQIYDKFFYIMYRDHATNQQDYQERLGLPMLAYVTLSIVMLRTSLFYLFESTQWSKITISIVLTLIWFIILLTLRQMTHQILFKWGVNIQSEWELHRRSTLVNSNDYVPGHIVDGIGKMDTNTREIIHDSETAVPPDNTEKRNNRDLHKPDSLTGITRYTMVSKAIW
ncbi:similar to Saccharomyces cerevisiae YER140W EMP65 Putative protein of unknown function [Maudiozyma saulgeensis]|uniref:Uncharacterized protein n=1 Tax=Maudiozyma saulgeensis TaxID=1789683 RepID=A0A1X7R8B1_9SACH|nr:similar to Saccharomyces cerevisiae YER140W EMP65 Putative protein of unknown function [Kazachstania saulgeensis]